MVENVRQEKPPKTCVPDRRKKFSSRTSRATVVKKFIYQLFFEQVAKVFHLTARNEHRATKNLKKLNNLILVKKSKKIIAPFIIAALKEEIKKLESREIIS